MLESDIQKSVISYCKSKHKDDFFVFSVSNEAIFKAVNYIPKIKRMMIFNQLLAMGLSKGFPDLVFIKNGKVVLIEMKAEKGKLNENQKKLFPRLEKFCKINVARSLDDVLLVLKDEGFIK